MRRWAPRVAVALVGLVVVSLLLTTMPLAASAATQSSAALGSGERPAVSGPAEISHQPAVTIWRVKIIETGLPSGTAWWATCNGTTKHSTAALNTFQVPDGTYGWSITNVSGYTVSPQSGSVTVANANITVVVTFTGTNSHGGGLLSKYWWALAAVGVIILLILILLVVRWRRRQAPPAAEWTPPADPMAEGAQPPSAASETPAEAPSGDPTPPAPTS
jgi:hypothetical protein